MNLLVTPAVPQPNPTALQILIVQGDGAINNVKVRTNRDTIIQVEDQNHTPIPGASVVFFLPSQGPGGTFPNGSSTLTTSTNPEGQAIARGISFNAQPGQIQIRVTASYAGLTTSLAIDQTNVVGAGSGGGSASTGGSSAKKWIIIAALAGGAAAAAGIALSHGGGSSSSGGTTSPPVTLNPGTVSVGGPQ